MIKVLALSLVLAVVGYAVVYGVYGLYRKVRRENDIDLIEFREAKEELDEARTEYQELIRRERSDRMKQG